jgi:hypothetical protein
MSLEEQPKMPKSKSVRVNKSKKRTGIVKMDVYEPTLDYKGRINDRMLI